VSAAPRTATKPAGAARTGVQQEVLRLHNELNSIHAQVRMLPGGQPNLWQAKLEQYLATASALYLTMMAE
jgi:hypothetical protein